MFSADWVAGDFLFPETEAENMVNKEFRSKS